MGEYRLSADVQAPDASAPGKHAEDGVIGMGLFAGKSFVIDRSAGKITLF